MSDLEHQRINTENMPPAPTDETVVVPPPEHRDDKHEKKGLGWKKPAAAVALLGAVGAGAFGIGKGMGGETSTPEPRTEPTASASANPGENQPGETGNETGNETAPLEFGLDAEKYKTNQGQIITDFFEQYNAWQNTGVTLEQVNADRRFEVTDEVYAAELNAESDAAFIDAMLVPDWQANPSLVEFVENKKDIHMTTTWFALLTAEGEENTEQYHRYTDIDTSTIVVDEGTGPDITVTAGFTGRDNSDKNRIDEIRTGNNNPNEDYGDYTMTFTEGPDGTMLLANIEER